MRMQTTTASTLSLLLNLLVAMSDHVNGFVSERKPTKSMHSSSKSRPILAPTQASLAYSNVNGDSLRPGIALEEESTEEWTRIISDTPDHIEIEDSALFFQDEKGSPTDLMQQEYPFALMMQGSGAYIAAHADETAIFHIPGELFYTNQVDSVLSDIALARTLGMKIILVVGCRYDTDSCSVDFDNAVHCHNSLKAIDAGTLRQLEEEAGFIRTEMERKLNRFLRFYGGGNVVSGNFFTAQSYGVVRGEDFEAAGFASNVHTLSIQKAIRNNDIVLLTTVGLSRMGDLVHVNGYHLAATVAASLNAYKVIYFANEGSVLCERDENGDRKLIQELPLSFAKSIAKHYGCIVHKTGFATYDSSQHNLEPRAMELLLHLGWAAWAVEQGVNRAHIVNPTDGALLEELFTSKNGANTCLYHDDETEQAEEEEETFLDWDHFFQLSSAKQDRPFRTDQRKRI